MSKVSPTTVIQDYVKSRSLPVTRQEIISGTMLSKDQVRKATNDLVNKGRLATELDELGVTRYMSPEANLKIAEATIVLDELEGVSKETVAEVVDSLSKPRGGANPWDTTITVEGKPEFLDKLMNSKPAKTVGAWGTLVEEAEERGFAKGYAVGVQEAQRAAYELGKESVISKLTGILR